ncbi:MAG: SufS family cysteine desulfurase [Alphaproteobacteria bacterium]|nr:SufS family cysteine desulfurase [Alphaproteobacteria bacterium]
MNAILRSAPAFDVARVRADFPILGRQVYGRPLVYLDNAASAQKPQAVIDAMAGFMESGYANVHRGVHYLSGTATDAFEAARDAAQAYVNAGRREEIVLTHGGTEAFNLVAESFLAPLVRPGDEIVLSEMEHHANIVPWHFLRERQGAVLKWARIGDDGALDIDHLAGLIGPRTRLVAVTHMSNVLGTVTPAAEIVRLAHARGVPVLLDGCQAAVHAHVDVRALDCDFYVFCAHKLYGPSGIGALYAKAEHLAAMRPWQGGGDMIREVGFDAVTYADPPHRFEAGTPPIVEGVGWKAAFDYLAALDRDGAHAHEQALLAYATAELEKLNWVRIFGRAPGKGAIVAFDVEGVHAHDLATIVDRRGVAVRAGHHCAHPLMQRLGVVSTARASFAFYNTFEEVDALVDAVRAAREMLT